MKEVYKVYGNSRASGWETITVTNDYESAYDEAESLDLNKYYEYMLIANKILARQSKYLNSCFIHFGWALTKYKDGFDKVAIKPLLKSILELYKQYFEGRNELNWDIEYAEKDIVERELCKNYKVYQSWGGQISFWDNYIPRYYY